jgi:hypothetical protein
MPSLLNHADPSVLVLTVYAIWVMTVLRSFHNIIRHYLCIKKRPLRFC